jgi:DNA-binding NarL/FixJ family response regulator
MSTTISVGIIEDDDDIREGLVAILQGSEGLSCRHVYDCCEKAVSDKRDPPGVMLMDIHLGSDMMSGIEGARRLKAIHPRMEILMLTVFDENEKIFDSLCAGASGYLLKNTPSTDIIAAVREVHAGGSPMSAIIARKVLNLFKTVAPPSLPDVNLTQREREVLEHLVLGMNYRMIAQKLFISLDTVASHVKHIYDKLHVHSKSEAVAKALKHKLV